MLIRKNDDGDPKIPDEWTEAYLLVLNDMRQTTEAQTVVAASDSREELVAFLQGETVEPYPDGRWERAFRKDGPLMWYNPPPFPDKADDWGHGVIGVRRDGWRRVE